MVSPRSYRPTVAQLRTFTTIAETEHFGTAACQLGISQPSLSQALAALEAGLGTQLIERSTRRVIVTPVGQSLLPYAKSTLENLDNFVSHAQGIQGGLVGPLNLGIIPTIAPFVLPDFFLSLPNLAPEVQIQIREAKTANLIEWLRQGSIDVAVVAGLDGIQGVSSTELYTEEFVLITPADSPLAGKKDVPLSQLEELDLLLMDEAHCLRDQVLSVCRNVTLRQHSRHQLTRAAGLSTIVQMVAAGLGSTLVPVSAVEAECQRPGLGIATLKDGERAANRRVALVYRPSSARVDDYVLLAHIIERAHNQAVARSHAIVQKATGGA